MLLPWIGWGNHFQLCKKMLDRKEVDRNDNENNQQKRKRKRCGVYFG